jgi:excisionase family DNA binding protein
VVQRGSGVGEARYLGVRELARLLGVSTATDYKAIARGELAHVRVSSVIRIPVGETDQAAISRPEAFHSATRPGGKPAGDPEKR